MALWDFFACKIPLPDPRVYKSESVSGDLGMAEAEPKTKERLFVVHTTGGAELKIKASEYFINPGDPQVYFRNGQGEDIKEWFVLLSGVAAIHETDPGSWGVKYA